MKKYLKVYMDYFGYDEGDFVPCEWSGEPATEVHHITPKSRGGKDVIENLMALSRKIHDEYHARGTITKEQLVERHNEILKAWQVKS